MFDDTLKKIYNKDLGKVYQDINSIKIKRRIRF